MNLIKPNILNKGDCISIIAPSGPVDFDKIIKSKTYFENAGTKTDWKTYTLHFQITRLKRLSVQEAGMAHLE